KPCSVCIQLGNKDVETIVAPMVDGLERPRSSGKLEGIGEPRDVGVALGIQADSSAPKGFTKQRGVNQHRVNDERLGFVVVWDFKVNAVVGGEDVTAVQEFPIADCRLTIARSCLPHATSHWPLLLIHHR